MSDQITGEITKVKDLDPMLAAVRQAIVDAQGELADFTAKNVNIVPPDAEPEQIDGMVQHAIAKSKGLSLIIIGGQATNPDKEAPGPRCTVEMELQLFVMPKRRPAGSMSPLQLVVALMRGLHDAQIRVTGFPWYDEIRWLSYGPIPDEDFVAYEVIFEREMSF